MRQVRVARLGRDVSAIGFGCASLGSRVSAAAGMRAVDHAFDLGVTWFDVAPPYGDGQAEALLGIFLHGRRDKVVICTKFGIARPHVSLPEKLLRPIARRIVSAFPGARTLVGKSRPTGQRVAMDPAAIKASVETSLRLLRTDYIDVLAMHDPVPEDAANPAIFEVLARLVDKGLVRAISIAGGRASIEAAVLSGRPVDIAQFPDSPFANVAPALRARLPDKTPFFITHSVFGSGTMEALENSSQQQHAALSDIAGCYGINFVNFYHDLLLHYAFSNNPEGVIIASMFDRRHIEHDIGASITPLPAVFVEDVRRAVSIDLLRK